MAAAPALAAELAAKMSGNSRLASCQTGTEVSATGQVIQMALDYGPRGPDGAHPERDYPDMVLNGNGRLRETTLAVAGVALAVGALAWVSKRR